jgi:hypothetical protein
MKYDDATAKSHSAKPLQIHDRYLVQWRGMSRGFGGNKEYIYLPALIIERRPARGRGTTSASLESTHKRKRKASSTHVEAESAKLDDLDSLPADAVEYYIHYIEHDRYDISYLICLL